MLGRELEIFNRFLADADALGPELAAVADGLARLDVAAANADWAADVSAVRPELADAPVFEAEGSRHPVVEASLRATFRTSAKTSCIAAERPTAFCRPLRSRASRRRSSAWRRRPVASSARFTDSASSSMLKGLVT